jgi:hypothetical protein
MNDRPDESRRRGGNHWLVCQNTDKRTCIPNILNSKTVLGLTLTLSKPKFQGCFIADDCVIEMMARLNLEATLGVAL